MTVRENYLKRPLYFKEILNELEYSNVFFSQKKTYREIPNIPPPFLKLPIVIN